MYVEVKNITKTLEKNIILDNISCSFDSGKIYGIRGVNGSGKTMLLKAIAGLVKVDQGEIIVGDQKLERGNEFPQDVSALIENPGMIPNYSGLKNLLILSQIRNRVSKQEIIDYMKRFKLDPTDNKKLKKYSLGMKQKIGIIAALMEDSKLILLDEPTNALDKDSITTLNEMLYEQKKKGNLIIITSHDSEELNLVSDEVYEIEAGKMKDRRTVNEQE